MFYYRNVAFVLLNFFMIGVFAADNIAATPLKDYVSDERITQHWQVLLTEEVTSEESYYIEDSDLSIPIKDLSENSVLFEQFVTRIATMEKGATRWYLIRILKNLPSSLRSAGAGKLMKSARTVDKHTAAYIYLSLDDVQNKARLIQPWLKLYTELDELSPILNTIRTDRELVESGLLNDALASIWLESDNNILKAHALRTSKPHTPTQDEMFNMLMSLLTSDDTYVVYIAVSGIADWLSSFSDVFTNDQSDKLIGQLDAISFDRRYDYNTRFITIDTVQVIINIVDSRRENVQETLGHL